MLNIPILILGVRVHLYPCVFASGEGTEPLTTVPTEVDTETFWVITSIVCGTGIRICLHNLLSNVHVIICFDNVFDFSDWTPKSRKWKEVEQLCRTVESRSPSQYSFQPSLSISPTPIHLWITQSTLPRAYLSCCQTPALCAQVLQGHLTELLIKSYNCFLLYLQFGFKTHWVSGAVGTW